MAQEGCNLDKDEAEILKPSSPSQPPPPATPTNINNSSPSLLSSTTSPPPTSLCLPQEFSSQKPDTPKNSVELRCKLKAKKESQPSIQFGSVNRCSSCRKRVGLTGFRCRCGDLFCALHRYSDTHDCSFDYKALGREEIAKANPLIRAAKIIKI